MRIRTPGKVREGLWFLGREESGVYLLEGRDGLLMINGGLSYIVPDLLRQFKEFEIDEGTITKLLILHSHFDHVGIVPFFKRRHPKMEVYASARAWEILRMPKTTKVINDFSGSVALRMGAQAVFEHYDLEWRDDVTGEAVREGESIDLGEIQVSILEVPGHSSCCIAGYVPGIRVLFPSDGSGIPFKESIIASGNSNYTRYQESLEKLKDLDVDYLCADHYGYVTGEEAHRFNSDAIEAAKQQRTLIEETYRSTRNTDVAARELTYSFYGENPEYFLPSEISFDVYRQMVRHIAGQMEGN